MASRAHSGASVTAFKLASRRELTISFRGSLVGVSTAALGQSSG